MYQFDLSTNRDLATDQRSSRPKAFHGAMVLEEPSDGAPLFLAGSDGKTEMEGNAENNKNQLINH